jgi:Transposase DDE domain
LSTNPNVCTKCQETIKKSASRNIRFIQAALSVVKSTRISPYSSKYSKKIYTQYQLLDLALFKDYRNQHYREFIEDVGDMAEVQDILDLSVKPHFTTLQKFISRIKTLYLRLTFRKTVNLFHSSDENIPITAIDSSGFTSGYCSHYFSERTGKIRKHFLKTSISVDTEQQVIVGFVASNSRVHDTRHAVKLLRQYHKIRKSDCYIMDKGYDSEAIHRLIREDLHANSVIPIRSWNNEIIGGTYRQEMAQRFNDTIYPRRQLVKTKFSVLKRKFGGDLKARRFLIQFKEIAIKMIVCNIYRFLLFLIVEVFYRATFLSVPLSMKNYKLTDHILLFTLCVYI